MHDPQFDDRRAEIARRNGALSRGPATPEGKARSAMNATRHGLCGRAKPEDADGHELADLRAALLARWQPMDAAEAHLVEELPEGWSDAPDVPPRRLNRHQRRRLAALQWRAA